MTNVLEFWRRFRSNRGAVVGFGVLLLIIMAAVIGPFVYPVDPFEMVGRPNQLPSSRFLLGTDVSGRDILAGLLHGARVSLAIGLTASVAAMVIGLVVGGIAGYYGGWLDVALMRSVDFFLTIPSFVLAVVIVAIFQPTIVTIIAAIAIVSWPSVARLARAEFATQKVRDYVEACRAMGMKNREIMLRQILPNALPLIVVVSSLMVATAILTEAGLSFLGLGDPNIISWGYMIGVGRTVLRSAWWVSAIPGVTILITVLAVNLVGEGLNEALNPRMRQR